MSMLNDFAKKSKFSMAAIHTPRENHDDLKAKINEIYGLQLDEFSGTSVLDVGIGIMQETDNMQDISELNPIVGTIRCLKANMALYSMVRNFVFDFAKFGPEIYEQLEYGNITPEKQWQIDLKKTENNFLYGNETDERARFALVEKLSETRTPITLKQLSAFLPQQHLDELREFLTKNQTEYLNHLTEDRGLSPDDALKQYFNYVNDSAFNISFDTKSGDITICPTPRLSSSIKSAFKSIPMVNIKQVELFKLAHIAEQAMKSYLTSGKVKETEGLSKNQNILLLKTFIKVAQKYQGISRTKEREMLPPDNDPPVSPPPAVPIAIKSQEIDFDKYQKYNDKKAIPNIIVEPKQPNLPDKEYNKKDFSTSEMPDLSPRRSFINPRDVSIADEILSKPERTSSLTPEQRMRFQKQEINQIEDQKRIKAHRYNNIELDDAKNHRSQDDEMCL